MHYAKAARLRIRRQHIPYQLIPGITGLDRLSLSCPRHNPRLKLTRQILIGRSFFPLLRKFLSKFHSHSSSHCSQLYPRQQLPLKHRVEIPIPFHHRCRPRLKIRLRQLRLHQQAAPPHIHFRPIEPGPTIGA